MDYKQMAAVLAAKLTDEEFVRFSELLDGDEYRLSEEVSAILEKTHPELFAFGAVYAVKGE